MKKTIISLCIIAATLSCTLFSCDKEKGNDPGTGNGNTTATTLPVNCDFTTASGPDGATTVVVSGVTFTRRPASEVYIAQWGSTEEWQECVQSGNEPISLSVGSYKGINPGGVLIADVSNLPAINKVTVKMFDNGKPGTRLSLCDGSNILAESKDNVGANPDVTYSMNVGGKKGSRLYIYSLEAIIYSVNIE